MYVNARALILFCQRELANLVVPSFARSTLSSAKSLANLASYCMSRERRSVCPSSAVTGVPTITSLGYVETRHSTSWGAAMKRCAQCHGKLGLGVRFRNLWNGRWWVHLRFCSTHCEGLYELERYEANARHRWYSFLV